MLSCCLISVRRGFEGERLWIIGVSVMAERSYSAERNARLGLGGLD